MVVDEVNLIPAQVTAGDLIGGGPHATQPRVELADARGGVRAMEKSHRVTGLVAGAPQVVGAAGPDPDVGLVAFVGRPAGLVVAPGDPGSGGGDVVALLVDDIGLSLTAKLNTGLLS